MDTDRTEAEHEEPTWAEAIQATPGWQAACGAVEADDIAAILDEALDLAVAELGLGLAFKLWIRVLDGNNCRQPFSNIFASQVRFRIFQNAVFAAVIVDDARQRRFKAGFVRSAFMGADIVRE